MEHSKGKPRDSESSRGFLVSAGQVCIRETSLSDVDAMMQIEKNSFSSPWSLRFFLEELRAPCAQSLLADAGNQIVGYIIYWLLPGEIDIHNIAVDQAHRRQGIGRLLLQSVIDRARLLGCGRITLEVRKSNEVAQRLYQSLGFVGRGVRKGYYSDDGEDALFMVLELKE
jgi:ribosomal-protein-alanine N-acetyltransferase